MPPPDEVLGWRDPPPRTPSDGSGAQPVPEPPDTTLSASLRGNQGQWALIGQNIAWGAEHDELVAGLSDRPGFEHLIAPVSTNPDGSLQNVDVYARYAGPYDTSPWAATGTVLSESGTHVLVNSGGTTMRVPYVDTYQPRPGDRVQLTGAGSERVVIGRLHS